MADAREVPLEDALTRYMDVDYEPPFAARAMCERNDKNTGWIIRNSYRYLAFVPDRGGVLR